MHLFYSFLCVHRAHSASWGTLEIDNAIRTFHQRTQCARYRVEASGNRSYRSEKNTLRILKIMGPQTRIVLFQWKTRYYNII